MAAHPIYQFHAELLDYKPKIWRRFQVPNNITMARLGYILMSMFEMKASHLFCLKVPTKTNLLNYLKGQATPDGIERVASWQDLRVTRFEIFTEDIFEYHNEENVKLLEANKHSIKWALSDVGAVSELNYDYGDNWRVHLVIEEIIIDKELPGKELPRILAGEGYGIIEDCGGTWGLKEVAKAFKKKKGKEYKEYCEWMGRDDLDLAAFDIDDANLRVKKIPRIYTDIYEFGIEPTQRSIDFLERKYLQPKKEKRKAVWIPPPKA